MQIWEDGDDRSNCRSTTELDTSARRGAQDLGGSSLWCPKVGGGVAQDLVAVGGQEILAFQIVVECVTSAVYVQAVNLDGKLRIGNQEIRPDAPAVEDEFGLVLNSGNVVVRAEPGHQWFEHAFRPDGSECALVQYVSENAHAVAPTPGDLVDDRPEPRDRCEAAVERTFNCGDQHGLRNDTAHIDECSRRRGDRDTTADCEVLRNKVV